MPPMPYAMSIGQAFTLLSAYLEDQDNMVGMLGELRDETGYRRLSDMRFFTENNVDFVAEAIAHIETDWFGWEPNTGVQDAFDSANPAKTGWWTGWYGNADKITRETVTRALEVALGVSHGSTSITPTRQWRIMFNWTCGAPLFQGWVVWQCDSNNPANGFVLCSFTTPGNGMSLYGTPYHPGNGPDGYVAPTEGNGNRGMWIIGDQCTDIRLPNSNSWDPVTGELPDWTNAFLYTHELPDPEQPGAFIPGVAVVAPTDEDGGMLSESSS